jgi:hypothetical protein
VVEQSAAFFYAEARALPMLAVFMVAVVPCFVV